jgi:MFS family permease
MAAVSRDSFKINEHFPATFWADHDRHPYVASSFRDGSTRLHLGSFIALGCSVLLLGPSLETFRTGAGVSLGQIGILISAGSIGYLLGSVSCGRLLEHFHAHRMLGGGLLLVAIALAALTTVQSLTALIVLQTVVGFGGAMVDVTGNTVVLWTHKGGAVMNALHLAFGVGAILGLERESARRLLARVRHAWRNRRHRFASP